MRTIRRVSLPLNRHKWETICHLTTCYRVEKNIHLRYYRDANFAVGTSERTRRDELVATDYTSPLQSRMWKHAQKDAYETVQKQWASLQQELTPLIQRHLAWSNAAKHYANWLIFTPQRMAELVSRRAPLPDHFTVPAREQKAVRNYLRRVIRRHRGSQPVAKSARSLAFDANMYSVFDEMGRQYISLMSLEKGKRLVVPLTGYTPIRGTIRVVLDFEHQRVEVHYTSDVKAKTPLAGEPCGLDAGLSEVFTDEKGARYVPELGEVIAGASEAVCDKGRKRSKLHALAEKAEKNGNIAKAERIHKFNLGTKKQKARQRRRRAEIERLINTAINQVVKQRQAAVVVTETLDIRGKAPSKRMSRRVSAWMRGSLKDRMEFKASAEGFRREQVNPAYSSQLCPQCGWVHRNNRKGDAFQCLTCGHRDDADRVAAQNLKARLSDSEIRLYTPAARVKEILLGRFEARLERGNPTVLGRTPGARTPASRSAKQSSQSRLTRENDGSQASPHLTTFWETVNYRQWDGLNFDDG